MVISLINKCQHGCFLLGSYFLLPKLSLDYTEKRKLFLHGITLKDDLLLGELCLKYIVHVPVTTFIAAYHW